MSALTERLRTLGIFNAHLFATTAKRLGGVGVFISYRTQQTGRAYQSAAWQVIDTGKKTDPGGHWQDYGHKTFGVYRPTDERESQRVAAVEWASAYCGVSEWVPGHFRGSLIPAQDKALVLAWMQRRMERRPDELESGTE